MLVIFFFMQNVRLKTDFVSKHFDVISSSINGSYHVVRAKSPGHTNINSLLRAVIKKVRYYVESSICSITS